MRRHARQTKTGIDGTVGIGRHTLRVGSEAKVFLGFSALFSPVFFFIFFLRLDAFPLSPGGQTVQYYLEQDKTIGIMGGTASFEAHYREGRSSRRAR
jgi:hypothetical protein